MDYARRVDDRQRVRDLARIVQRFVGRQRCVELPAEMAERKVLHRDIAVLARDAEIVDLRDGMIIDVVQQLELGDEALEVRVARQRAAAAMQHLEHDFLAALRAECHVYRDASRASRDSGACRNRIVVRRRDALPPVPGPPLRCNIARCTALKTCSRPSNVFGM